MNIPNIKGLVTIAKSFVMANRPELLLGASIASQVASIGLAGKGGYEAGRKVMVAEHPSYDLSAPEAGAELDIKEKAKLTWQCYIPAAVGTVGALGSTTGLHLAHCSDKKALVSSALGAIEEAKESAREFERRNIGILSDDEQEKILSKREDKKTGTAKVLYAGDGVEEELYRVKDNHTGRVFWSTKEKIDAAVNEVNKGILKNGCSDINTFYMWAGVEELERGIEEGWSGTEVNLTWEDGHTENGKPCKVFTFRTPPQRGYDNSHA